MRGAVGGPRGSAEWLRQATWALAAVLASAVLGTACIMFGAVLAMLLESGTSPAAGAVVNGAALAVMTAVYSVLVVLVMRALTSRAGVPFAVWPALGVLPLAWGLVVIALPDGPYGIAPAVVMGVGALAAWLVIGRHVRGDTGPVGEHSPPG